MAIVRDAGRFRGILDALVSIVMVIAACILVYNSFRGSSRSSASGKIVLPTEPYTIHGAQTRGSRHAEHVLVMFSDFECPFCRRFAREVLPEVDRRYVATGRVLFVLQHLPLKNHPNALPAAVSAECAGQQNRFWPMHDRLLEASKLDASEQEAIARTLGLDMDRFGQCVMRGEFEDAIAQAAEKSLALGIKATPAFFLGSRLSDGRVEVREAFSGALSIDAFTARLDSLLEGSRWPIWNWKPPFPLTRGPHGRE